LVYNKVVVKVVKWVILIWELAIIFLKKYVQLMKFIL
jgi:hypothetical protein